MIVWHLPHMHNVSYSSNKIYAVRTQKNRLIVVGTQKIRLNETVILSTHNICYN